MLGQPIYINKAKFIEDKCQVLLAWFKNEPFEVSEGKLEAVLMKNMFLKTFLFWN